MKSMQQQKKKRKKEREEKKVAKIIGEIRLKESIVGC